MVTMAMVMVEMEMEVEIGSEMVADVDGFFLFIPSFLVARSSFI